MNPDWIRIPASGCRGQLGELIANVRSKIDCSHEEGIEAYASPNFRRVFRLLCRQCPQEVLVKTFGHDPDASAEERRLRLAIERQNLESLAAQGLSATSFPEGWGRVPRVLGWIEEPHFALILEYFAAETLDSLIVSTIQGAKKHDLLSALSLLARFIVSLHERTLTASYGEDLPSLRDSMEILDGVSSLDDSGDVVADLRRLNALWIGDRFFTDNMPTCQVHDALTPVNTLYSPNKPDIVVLDSETMHRDTPFADIGTVTAELKVSFALHGDNSYLAEPYIGHFLRQYFAHQRYLRVTYRQFTWLQGYFMGRRLLKISQGRWLDSSLQKWCVATARDIWSLARNKTTYVTSPFVGIKAVLFDFYGTLVLVEDDEEDLANFRAVRNAIRETFPGVKVSALPSGEEIRSLYFDEIKKTYERSREEFPDVDLELIWAGVLERPEIGVPTYIINRGGGGKLRRILRAFRESAVKRFDACEGVRDVIKTLRDHGMKIGILSDAQPAYVEGEMERLGIHPYLDLFIYSARFRFRKPDTRFFRWGLEKIGVSANEAVFIGDDMYRDIFGAQRVGMRTIYKPSPYGCSYHEGCNPDEVITDLRMLPGLLGASSHIGARGE